MDIVIPDTIFIDLGTVLLLNSMISNLKKELSSYPQNQMLIPGMQVVLELLKEIKNKKGVNTNES